MNKTSKPHKTQVDAIKLSHEHHSNPLVDGCSVPLIVAPNGKTKLLVVRDTPQGFPEWIQKAD